MEKRPAWPAAFHITPSIRRRGLSDRSAAGQLEVAAVLGAIVGRPLRVAADRGRIGESGAENEGEQGGRDGALHGMSPSGFVLEASRLQRCGVLARPARNPM